MANFDPLPAFDTTRYGVFLYKCGNDKTPHECDIANRMKYTTITYRLVAMNAVKTHQHSKKLAWLLRNSLPKDGFPDQEHSEPPYPDMEARRAEGEARAQEMAAAIAAAREAATLRTSDDRLQTQQLPFLMYLMQVIVDKTTDPLSYTFDQLLEIYTSGLRRMFEELRTLPGTTIPDTNYDTITCVYMVRTTLEFYVSSMRRRGTDMECVPFLLTRDEWVTMREDPPLNTSKAICKHYDTLEVEFKTAAIARVLFPKYVDASCPCLLEGGFMFVDSKTLVRMNIAATLGVTKDGEKVVCTTAAHNDEEPCAASYPDCLRSAMVY